MCKQLLHGGARVHVCLYPTWPGGQDKFSCPQEDKNFPLKRLRAKRREGNFFFLRAGKIILPYPPCRIAIPKSYSIASTSSKDNFLAVEPKSYPDPEDNFFSSRAEG